MAFSDEVLADSPLRYWNFRQAGATVPDQSGNGGDGTLHDSYATQQPTLVGEAGDYAVLFNDVASPGVFQADMPAEIEATNSPYRTTVEIVCKVSVNANGGLVRLWHLQPRDTLWRSTSNQGTGAGLWAWQGNFIELWFRRSAGGIESLQIPAATFELFDNKDHHITAVLEQFYSGGTKSRASLYVDGALIATQDFGLGVPDFGEGASGVPSPSRFYLGGSCALGVDAPVGDAGGVTFGEAALYDAALSAARLEAHAIAGGQFLTGVATSLRAYLRFDTREKARARAYLRASIGQATAARAWLHADSRQTSVRAWLRANTTNATSVRAWLRADTATDYSVAQRAGVRWGLQLLIDGVDQAQRLHGTATTSRKVGEDAVATFDLMPEAGALDPAAYSGAVVRLIYLDYDNAGGTHFGEQVFAGQIVEATWQPARGVLACRASNRQSARLRAASDMVVARQFGGYHSERVFSHSSNGWDFARDRMETLQGDAWLHDNGAVTITPWHTTAVAGEWGDDQIRPGSLRHQFAQRSRLVNRILLRLDYRYPRRRQRTIKCSFSHGVTWCERLLRPFPLAQRAQIAQAAEGAGGWQLIGDVYFVRVPGPGAYRCFPFAPGSNAKYALWGGDANDEWAWLASWLIARRWQQDITEHREFDIRAARSIEANGLIEQVEDYSVRAEIDNTEWLAERGFRVAGSGFVQTAAGQAQAGNGVVLGDVIKADDDNGAGNRAEFEQAQQTALAAAAADVIRPHRHLVTASSFFDPRVRGGMRWRINNAKLRATGLIVGLRNTFELRAARAYTDIDIAPFQDFGFGFADASPIEPLDTPAIEVGDPVPDRLHFRTYIGGLTTSLPYNETWAGYTTNYEHDPTDDEPFAAEPRDIGNRHYPNQFRVEYPEIPAQDLQAIETQAKRRIDVAVPDDELVIIQ